MTDKKPYTTPSLERTHHVWRPWTAEDVRPDCVCRDCTDARELQAEVSIQRALDIELDKVRRHAAPRTSLVERDLVCPTCRRSFGRVLAPLGAPVHPVCEGCILEGRM